MPGSSAPIAENSPAARIEAQTSSWIQHELGQAMRPIARIRIVAATALCAVGIFLWFVEATTWRSWVLIAGAIPLIILAVIDYRLLREPRFTTPRVSYYMGSILFFQSIAIICTGGIDSPVIFIWVPWAIIAAFAYGELRLFLLAATAPMVLVISLTLARTLGIATELVPSIFGGPAAVIRNDLYLWTFSGALMLIMLLTGVIALRLRQGLNRAVSSAALARHEAVATMGERNRELYQLSGALAHELKNPLTSIQGLAGLLTRKAEPGSKQAEQLAVLLGEVRRMGTVLDEFLNFSRPTDNLAVRAVDPGRLIADVVSLHEGIAAERGITIELSPALSTPLRADPRKLKQVLVNLVQNALEATPRGGVVGLGARAADDHIVFEVTDSGAGLDPEIKERLFRPGATTKAEGSGLGLVIARSIAEQHHGSLALDDLAGGGCRASFRLPLVYRAESAVTAEEGEA